MSIDEVISIKALIASILEPTLASRNGTMLDLPDDLDLRLEGLVDSFGFMHLIAELQSRLGCEINLAELPPEQLTKVGPLARHIAWRRVAS